MITEFPDLLGHLPKRKRRIFDYEPRSMVIFETLALAKEVMQAPLAKLAAAVR